MSFNFSLNTTEDETKHLTAFINGKLFPTINDTHPNFDEISGWCMEALDGNLEEHEIEHIIGLFDVAATVERKFSRLTERVTVTNNELLVDGDPAQPGLSKHVLRMLGEGQDVDALVNFLEKITSNPNEHSRDQAWDWLNNHDFTITPSGDVVGYKGVYDDGKGGYQSGRPGHAFRNGEEILHGCVPNAVGDTIEMPRSEVMHDPGASCHAGLHIGTFNYAKFYAQGAMLKVTVNPRDIVSVPTDASGEKIRVCRYKVQEIIDAPETKSVDSSSYYDDDTEDYYGEEY